LATSKAKSRENKLETIITIGRCSVNRVAERLQAIRIVSRRVVPIVKLEPSITLISIAIRTVKELINLAKKVSIGPVIRGSGLAIKQAIKKLKVIIKSVGCSIKSKAIKTIRKHFKVAIIEIR
jgi:hypothetical protein